MNSTGLWNPTNSSLLICNPLTGKEKRMKSPILERIETWYSWALANGIVLTRILIHPEDVAAAPEEYKGLPVVPFGSK